MPSGIRQCEWQSSLLPRRLFFAAWNSGESLLPFTGMIPFFPRAEERSRYFAENAHALFLRPYGD